MSIYASPTGGRYHGDATCGTGGAFSGLPDQWPTITVASARARRLTPCKTCAPPPMLTLVLNETP